MTIRELDAEIRFYKREMDAEVEKYGVDDQEQYDPYSMSKERVQQWERWFRIRKDLVDQRWMAVPDIERERVYAWLRKNENKHRAHVVNARLRSDKNQ